MKLSEAESIRTKSSHAFIKFLHQLEHPDGSHRPVEQEPVTMSHSV